MLALVPETTKVIMALAAYAGLSKSEIQGLVWEAYSGTELAVLSSVVNGKRGEPKTKARRDTVPVIEPLRKMLDMHRLRLGNPTCGVMFPTKQNKKTLSTNEIQPLSLHNVFHDYIEPALNRCEQCHEVEAKH